MKKFKTLLLTSLTAVVLCFCFLFAGCGSVAGTYSVNKIEMELLGEVVEYEVGDTVPGMGTITEEEFPAITLNEDNTVADMEGATWAEKDGKIVITYGEGEEAYEVASFEKSGSKLIMEQSMGGMTLRVIYKK